MSIDNFREQIDGIDNQILDLLNQRAKLAMEIGRIKKERRQQLYVPSREQAIFERLEERNSGPFPREAIHRVYREIISASLSLEFPMRVAYLGPRATFTHFATVQQFGQSAQLVPVRTIDGVFAEIASKRAECGVVPIENSNEGAVTHTLDMFMKSELTIMSELYLEISHDLMGICDNLSSVDRLYSHTQAIEQCRVWLEEHLPHVQVIEVSSTARAAEMVAEEKHAVAIANRHAASIYGLRVLASSIETNPHNFTRFLVIGNQRPEPTGRDKTSILFTFRDEPGILGRMLEPFRSRNLNLMKIESRPIKKKAWEYCFFLDIEGHIGETHIHDAIEELSIICRELKVLGSYPRGR